MYIAGAKFEDHCFNISGDILDSVFYCLCETIYDVITFLICIIQKCEYLENEKRYSKKEHAILLYFEKPFKKATITLITFNYFWELECYMYTTIMTPCTQIIEGGSRIRKWRDWIVSFWSYLPTKFHTHFFVVCLCKHLLSNVHTHLS